MPNPAAPAESVLDDQIAALVARGRHAAAFALASAPRASRAEARRAVIAQARILGSWGRTVEALDALIGVAPAPDDTLDDLRTLAWRSRVTGSGDALTASLAVIERPGHSPEDRTAVGAVLLALGRVDEAEAMLASALAREPGCVDAVLGLVQVRLVQDRAGDALALLDAAIRDHPRHRVLQAQRGALLGRLDRHDEAVDAFARLLREFPDEDPPDTAVALGIALCHAGRTSEGAEVLVDALPRAPLLQGFLQLGPALLALGDYEHGWPMFEHRWLAPPLFAMRAESGIPPWRGQPLAGKTVMVRAEQGIGDNVQFARFLPELRARGATVLFQPLQGLAKFAAGFPGVDRVVDDGERLPPCDFFIDLMSLPAALGLRVDAIPTSTPYLTPDVTLREMWRQRLRGDGRMHVGIAWAGRPEHRRDRHRSVTLGQLAPVLRVPGAHFVSIQKGAALRQAEQVPEDIDWTGIGPELDDLDSATAALSVLDLLICVDTGLAHIGGALGVETWMLVALPPDYRWLESGSRTSWYPSMRLFRQESRGDWKVPVEAVARALDARIRGVAPVEEPVPPASVAPFDSVRFSSLAHCASTRVGYLQYVPGTSPAGAAIHRYGEWQRALLELLASVTPKGGVLLEIGAGFGAHTVPLARVVGASGIVLAWEPDAATRTLLARNLETHGLRRVEVIARRLAGSAEAAPATTDTVDELHLGSVSGIRLHASIDPGSILSGASATLWRCRPWICVAGEPSSFDVVRALLEDHGYAVYRMLVPRYREDNYYRAARGPGDDGADVVLFALPEERPFRDLPAGCEAWT